MDSRHFIEKCKHGRVVAQCRCPGPKKEFVVECQDKACHLLNAKVDLTSAELRIAELESSIVWLVDNIEIRIDHTGYGEPFIAWPGFDLLGDMTADQIVEAVKRAREASR